MEDTTPNTEETTPVAEEVAKNTVPETGAVTTTESPKATKAEAVATNNVAKDEHPKTSDYESRYKEVQRAYTQESQRRAGLEKKVQEIEQRFSEQAKQVAALSKQPYDPEKFLTEFRDKGPAALDTYYEEKITSLKEEYGKQSTEYKTAVKNLEGKILVMERRSDAENYPDFRKLEPRIAEMIDDPKTAVDFTKPAAEVLDALYKLAREGSSVEAIKEAEHNATAKAEASLVKESKTTMTGGSRTVGMAIPDLDKLDMDKVREHFAKLNGIVDRD